MSGRNGLRSLALMAAVIGATAPSESSRLVVHAGEPTPEIPKSALGDGSRARHRDKPAFDRSALKRRRKLARQSQRRNRGRS